MSMQAHDERTLGELLSCAVDSFGDLVALHIALTRAELARDAGRVASDLVPMGVGAVLMVMGYLMLCIAAGAGLGFYIGPVGGFAIIGMANVLLGGLALQRSAMRLSRPIELELSTGAEVRQSARALFTRGAATVALDARVPDAS